MIQKISGNFLRIVKDLKISLRSSTSRIQTTQSQRIHHLREKKISQERILEREAGEIHRQINSTC